MLALVAAAPAPAPATRGADLSLTWAFLRPLPCWICCRRAAFMAMLSGKRDDALEMNTRAKSHLQLCLQPPP